MNPHHGTPRANVLGVLLMWQKGKQYRGRRIATPVCALARNDKGDLVRRGVTRRMAAPSEREPGKAGGAIWGSRPTCRWAVPRVGRDAFIPPFSSPSLADRADLRQPLREDGERGNLIRPSSRRAMLGAAAATWVCAAGATALSLPARRNARSFHFAFSVIQSRY